VDRNPADHRPARAHRDPAPFTTWTEEHLRALGDLGYEDEQDIITVAFKKPEGGELADTQKTYNKVHNGIRAVAERGNSLLKMTFTALRNVSLCPWTIGRIAAAARVLLQAGHGRTA
jgi:DDE superfamily endonuclease